MLRTFRHIARSEILENDDKFSVSQRSTKSMFEEPVYDKFKRRLRDGFTSFDLHQNNEINAKVRKAIENSFIKQMEENAALEIKLNQNSKIERISVMPKIKDPNLDEPKPEKSEPVVPHKKPRKAKAPLAPRKLPDMIKELPNGTNTAKRIMDAVIKEMVDVKLEPCPKSQKRPKSPKSPKIYDYEVDSLERSKTNRKSSTSPESTDHSSPTLSTALPMEEELTMQNAIINANTGEMTISKMKKQVKMRLYIIYYMYNIKYLNFFFNQNSIIYNFQARKKNCYNLPEMISQKEGYSLVSEVYVNDGYTSPTGSDDSGPEIQYEPENPGHLTIKVQDSPRNYVKLDESEYEPDTLDRKPMKLKVNGDVHYEKEVPSEVYADSLERPSQILLRSKGSFNDEDSTKNGVAPLHRSYGSLRAIYEARLKVCMKEVDATTGTQSLNNEVQNPLSWKKNRLLHRYLRYIFRVDKF